MRALSIKGAALTAIKAMHDDDTDRPSMCLPDRVGRFSTTPTRSTLLGEGPELAAKDTLYRCVDRLLPHKDALQMYLKDRWQDLFGASFDVLLYDLTSTYFESDPPFEEEDKRRFGYSRDQRFDCVQVVIALIVTPEGLPLTYEVLSGNTADSTTLPQFLDRIEKLYGSARRIWVMDRGIPTEAHLELMRARGGRNSRRNAVGEVVGQKRAMRCPSSCVL